MLVAPAPVVMGVLNVTPDSFSDGGRYASLDEAVRHAVTMRADGADLVDVGGESTRPGADRVDAATESGRVLPVLRALADAGVPTSIDTTRAEVAEAALAAGASRGQRRVRWARRSADGLGRGRRRRALGADALARTLEADAGLGRTTTTWWRRSATSCGNGPTRRSRPASTSRRIILDPGLGFAKRPEHNWRLSAHLDAIIALGYPVLVGASRKSYLGTLLADAHGTPRPVAEREAATVATSLLAVQAGAWGVRVHDVRATVDALRVLQATQRAREANQETQ